ncbi:hypothetical protein CL3_03060 [butyrate-producing bacterium SM4/1]|nr:hypothetical protein CLS_00990 [[Clostridium] cf. saccharolyticum K10]CBL35579.1 hypothetical protein CL3_03060 [butyrate-producing bacterium SM4/1]
MQLKLAGRLKAQGRE